MSDSEALLILLVLIAIWKITWKIADRYHERRHRLLRWDKLISEIRENQVDDARTARSRMNQLENMIAGLKCDFDRKKF